MKIRLVNFRCYSDETFDFGDQGLALLSGPSGQGKCLGKNTEVLLYDGTIKKVQDIIVGDILMGDDSTPRTVLSTCSGNDELYEIIPTKGRSYIVNSKHILTLKGDITRIKYRKYRKTWVVEYTKYGEKCSNHFSDKENAILFMNSIPSEPIYDINIEEYLKLPKSSQRYNYTFHTGVDFEEKKIPLDPYLLGVWLGDRTSNECSISNIDSEILQEISEILSRYDLQLREPSSGCTYRIINKDDSKSVSHRNTSGIIGVLFHKDSWICRWKDGDDIKCKYFSVNKYGNDEARNMASEYIKTKSIIPKTTRNFFTDKLKELRLWGNKHVPNIYKSNTKAIRLEILAGIIDADSYVNDNVINIVQKRKELAENIEYISLSLGFMATLKIVSKTCTNGSIRPVTNEYYQVTIFGDGLETIPTRLKRKRLFERKQKKRATVQGFQVVSKGVGEYYGFELDGNGRFLLGDFTVTHNSSILMGIYFALFGSGNKLQTYGKTSCRVELDFDDMKIVRTKRPNRLVVNDIYEDQAAQDIINQKFGDTFDVTGYISQNALNSFILMSPIEKLAFLERFAFQNVDLGKIKGRCKAVISKRHEELIGVVSQLEMAKNVLEELEQPDEVRFPLKCSIKNRPIAIKNENTRYKNCGVFIKKSQKKVKELEQELSDIRVLHASTQNQENALSDLLIKEVELESKNINYIGDEALRDYELRLKRVLAQRELISLETQYDEDSVKLEEMEKNEKTVIENEIEQIKEQLWKDYSKSEFKNTLRYCKTCLSDIEKLQKLCEELKRTQVEQELIEENRNKLETNTKRLDELRKRYGILRMQQELYSCPSCKSKLRMIDDELILAEDAIQTENLEQELEDTKNEINTLKNVVAKLQRLVPELENKYERYQKLQNEIKEIEAEYEEIPEAESLREDIESLHEYQASQLELEKKLKRLETKFESESFSTSFQSFQTRVQELGERVRQLRDTCQSEKEQLTEEELRQIIYDEKQNRDQLRRLEKDKSDTSLNIAKLRTIIFESSNQHVEKYGEVRDEKKIATAVEKVNKEIEKHEKKQNEHGSNLEKMKAWEAYNEAMENYRHWENKIEELETKEKEARNKYASATMLKDKILEAESLAMLHIIDSINTHAQLYLDCFFPEHPISVRLQPFKETKKSTNPKISLEIEYKGMECDLTMLSGGELSRVILAYTLALAEMFNTPLLLLDECTASLDQDMTSVVFNGIRDHFNGKLTLIIAHQIITGTFDTVIKLGDT